MVNQIEKSKPSIEITSFSDDQIGYCITEDITMLPTYQMNPYYEPSNYFVDVHWCFLMIWFLVISPDFQWCFPTINSVVSYIWFVSTSGKTVLLSLLVYFFYVFLFSWSFVLKVRIIFTQKMLVYFLLSLIALATILNNRCCLTVVLQFPERIN